MSSAVALSPVEQSALKRIEDNLSQGWFNDVSKNELLEINKIVGALNPQQKTNVISNLSDDKLKSWGNELDGMLGGLSDTEQSELFDILATDLNTTQLGRVHDAFGNKDEFLTAVQNKSDAETAAAVENRVSRNQVTANEQVTEADNTITPEAFEKLTESDIEGLALKTAAGDSSSIEDTLNACLLYTSPSPRDS